MTWVNCIPITSDSSSLSDDEIVLYIKAWRKVDLASCDWTQLPDVDLSNKLEWTAYRQNLRDIPQQGSNPKQWVFPEKP